MKTSQKGIDLIKHFEGCRLEAYKCPAGVWTIGYGHTRGVKINQKITINQAEQFLIEDLKVYEKAVNELITVKLNQAQFDALVSFTYNLGVGALSGSTLRKKLNAGLYNEIPNQLKRWVYAGRKRYAGLIIRRKVEAHLFSTGELNFKI